MFVESAQISSKYSIEKRLLKARWLLPMDRAPIEFGVLQIEGERITGLYTPEEFRNVRSDCPVEDFTQAIIVPGFINLHTHLDYTAARLFDTTSSLFDWIPGLMTYSRRWSDEQFFASALLGAKEIANSGTSTVFDSSYSGAAARALGQAGLRGIVGLELFGLDERDDRDSWQRWLDRRQSKINQWLAAPSSPAGSFSMQEALQNGRVKISVAPHAPYTVSPGLIRFAKEWAAEQDLPWTMHLCETESECNWMRAGDRVVDDFLLGLSGVVPGGDVANLSWRSSGVSPIKFLQQKELLDERLVAAHGVWLTDDEIVALSQLGVKIAHCPRSNARLRSGIARVPELIAAGVEVGFGTDSAASNDNLDVLAEARFAANLQRALNRNSSWKAESVIRRLTVEAAKLIGLDQIGTLESGKLADVAIFNVADGGENIWKLPYDTLLHGEVALRQLLVGGRKVVDKVL